MDLILDSNVVNKLTELAFKDKLKQVRQISLTDKKGMPIDSRLQVTVCSTLEKTIVAALAEGYTIQVNGGYINVDKAKYCLNGGDLGKDYAHFFSDDELNDILNCK
jgi:hypothetical protein